MLSNREILEICIYSIKYLFKTLKFGLLNKKDLIICDLNLWAAKQIIKLDDSKWIFTRGFVLKRIDNAHIRDSIVNDRLKDMQIWNEEMERMYNKLMECL